MKCNSVTISSMTHQCVIKGTKLKRNPTQKQRELVKGLQGISYKRGLVVNEQCPKNGTLAVLSEMIFPVSKVHNYNTRYATNQNLYKPASRTNYGLARFKVIASKIWETIPTEMKCLSHIKFQKESSSSLAAKHNTANISL